MIWDKEYQKICIYIYNAYVLEANPEMPWNQRYVFV